MHPTAHLDGPKSRVTPLSLHFSPACVPSALPKQKMRAFSTPGAAPHQAGGKWFKQGMSKLDQSAKLAW